MPAFVAACATKVAVVFLSIVSLTELFAGTDTATFVCTGFFAEVPVAAVTFATVGLGATGRFASAFSFIFTSTPKFALTHGA